MRLKLTELPSEDARRALLEVHGSVETHEGLIKEAEHDDR